MQGWTLRDGALGLSREEEGVGVSDKHNSEQRCRDGHNECGGLWDSKVTNFIALKRII